MAPTGLPSKGLRQKTPNLAQVQERIKWLCENRANRRSGFPGDDRHPRGGDVTDVHRLIHELGYSVYRVNTVVQQEIFDKHGLNVNTHMAAGRARALVLCSMKKLEYLSPDFPLERYPEIMRWGTSLLITRKSIISVSRKYHIDMNFGLCWTAFAERPESERTTSRPRSEPSLPAAF